MADGATPARRGEWNWPLAAAGLAALAAFVGIYVADRGLYERVVDLWSFHVGPEPFIDLSAPLAWIRCWRMGVDVFLATPCDLMNRPICYSPLLLRLPLPWVEAGDTPAYALLIETMYLACLAVLPRPRVARDALPMLLLLFSPLCVFGVERANLDLLIFAMVAASILCIERGIGVRLLGYALILAAGLVKFYPWVLLLLLLRERPAVCLLLGCVAGAVIAGFAGVYHDELVRTLANMPQPQFADDAFGAMQTAGGLVVLTHAFHAAPGQVDAVDIAVWAGGIGALLSVSLVAALRIGRGDALRDALGHLSGREALCLTAGSILMCGSFYTGISVGYRAIYLLFALPGLLSLARQCDDRRIARLVRATIVAALIVVWSLPMQRAIIALFGRFLLVGSVTPLPGAAYWLLREGLWWWLMTVLLAVIIRAVLDSRSWTGMAARLELRIA